MNARTARIVLASTVLSSALVVPTTTAAGGPRADAPDLALVGVGASRGDAAHAIRAAGGRIQGYNPAGFFEVDPPGDAASWARSLDDPAVRYAEPEQIGTLDAVPNDPLWGDQWGLDRVGATDAWDRERGSADVVVAVVDSGIDHTHEDLADNIWSNSSESAGIAGVDDDGNGYVDDVRGIDCQSDDVDPYDEFFHGTHVAGTIGAVGNNGTGVAGVNWDVGLMALKWTNSSGTGLVNDAVECLDYAVDNGAQVINASWGFPLFSQTLADAIDRAEAAGVLVVASAGNGGDDLSVSPRYPASLQNGNLMTVAATDRADALASFSNYGTDVELAAPGVEIWSTQPLPPNAYWRESGTSFSTAITSGGAALIWAAEPTASATDVRDLLMTSVEALPGLVGLVATGGLLDLGAAVPDHVPSAPSGLVATPLDAEVALGWHDALEIDVTSYVVERTVDPLGAPTRTWDVVATPAGSEVADGGLTNGVTYHYRVRAVDIGGNVSDPSDEVAVTPESAAGDFPITSITVNTGVPHGDPISSVASSDDERFDVDGQRRKNRSTAAWEGSTTVERSGATGMELTFEANGSAAGSVSVYVRRVSPKPRWDLAGTMPLSASDATLTWSTAQVATFTTAAGEFRIRVTFEATSSQTTTFGTDLASVRMQY